MKKKEILKEECPYCNLNIKLEGDSDCSVFNWHLAGHGEKIAENDYEISKLESEFNIKHIEIENPDWVKAIFSISTQYERNDVIKLICEKVNKLLNETRKQEELCEHSWEVTLTDRKQFNYCTECEKCNVIVK